jgi:hypothetical protein
MPLSEFKFEKAKQALDAFMAKRRPPEHIRPELDFEYRIEDQSIELLEVRPYWDDPAQILRMPFAKATYVKSADHWKVFWKRASGKWETYAPQPTVNSVEEFTGIVHADAHYCFFG